jgi:hypothetical protein
MLVVIFAAALTPTLLPGNRGDVESSLGPMAVALMAGMSLFVPAMLPFDFRGDLDRMDLLKALPLPAWRLVVGQLFTPVLLVCVVQLLLLAGVQVLAGQVEPLLWAFVAFLVPLNALLFQLENLFFLWFPSRIAGMGPGDFQFLGRHMLLWIAKLIVLLVVGFVAFLVGFVAFLVTGGSWLAGGVLAWVVLAAVNVGVLPLVALAFDQFDVARDLP